MKINNPNLLFLYNDYININEYNYENVRIKMKIHELDLLFLHNKNCRNLLLLTCCINTSNERLKFMFSAFYIGLIIKINLSRSTIRFMRIQFLKEKFINWFCYGYLKKHLFDKKRQYGSVYESKVGLSMMQLRS